MWNIRKHVNLSNDERINFMTKKDITENFKQNITNELSIQTSSPNLQKKLSKRCNYIGCNKKLTYIDKSLGCSECDSFYCGIHRLPEEHNCFGLDLIKYKSKQLLEDKLIREKCSHEKVIKI